MIDIYKYPGNPKSKSGKLAAKAGIPRDYTKQFNRKMVAQHLAGKSKKYIKVFASSMWEGLSFHVCSKRAGLVAS